MMAVFELEEVISDDKEIHIDVNKHISGLVLSNWGTFPKSIVNYDR